jgi:hypothetical protein
LAAGGVVASAIAFSPVVRGRMAAEGARWHVTVEARGVRAAWFGACLLDVLLRPEGMPSVDLHADSVCVRLNWDLRVRRVDVTGGGAFATGTDSELRAELGAWRRARARAVSGVSSRSSNATVTIRGAALRWAEGDSVEPRIEARGIDADVDHEETRVDIGEAKAHAGPIAVDLSRLFVTLWASGSVARARAEALTVEWKASGPESPGLTNAQPAPDPGATMTSGGKTKPAPRVVDELVADPPARIVALPDIGALRALAAWVARELNEGIAPEADIGIGSVTWKMTRPDDPIALSLGPGPLSLQRSPQGLELRFSTDVRVTGTPLSVVASLPSDGRDVTATLDGGPISLAMLGVREGAAGLVNVENSTVTAKARLALADDGRSLTFDGEGGASGVSIQSHRLATDVVRGLDLHARGRGILSSSGALRVDDFSVSSGALEVGGSGILDQEPDHVAGTFRLDVPSTRCQSLLDSAPAALLPVLQGMKVEGTFGASGRVAFDTRSLDELQLDYDVRDRCRITAVPPALAPEQFQHPFIHKIVLPDGTLEDQWTGPDSPNWSSLDDISPYMQVAVLTTEDGAFVRHHGFNRASIRQSIITNLKARRFVRGASTITMQLAKNLFLDREKTLSRKLEEVIITEYLEQTFAKDELMELYLNVIEFGPAVYGVTAAADYYFGRTPAELNLAECLFLASLLPAPLRYGAMREGGEVPDGWMHLIHRLMTIAHKTGRITDDELAEGQGEAIAFWRGGDRPPARPPVRVRPAFDDESDDSSTVPLDEEPPADSP